MKRTHLAAAALLLTAVRLPGQTVSDGLNAPPLPSASTWSAAFTSGKFSLDERLREEYADQENLKDSDALTLRTLFGYTTARYEGVQAMLEGGNTAVLNSENGYSAGGTNPGGAGRTVVPEVPASYLNQAWASYDGLDTLVKVGRQRLILDNARFVGDVNWWQKMQTFDAATADVKPAPGLSIFYGYLWHINRIYDNEAPQPDWTSHSNLIHFAYTGWAYGTFAAYAYRLDFPNSPANSSDTYGGYFAGSAPVAGGFRLTYRAEAATQQSAGNAPLAYRAPYTRYELGGAEGPVTVGAGLEELGSDHGLKGFATPLATLHSFDGWDNEFLTTPPYGLRDAFLSAGLALPARFPVQLIYHDFHSAHLSQTYGHEWDGLVTHKIGAHWNLLLEIARYYGEPLLKPTATYGTRKCWIQTEFTF